VGPAALTAALTSPSKFLKFSTNMFATLTGLRIIVGGIGPGVAGIEHLGWNAGTRGRHVEVEGPRHADRSAEVEARPDNARVDHRRGCAPIFMRLPVPYGPPVQPVFTSHTRD